MNKSLIWRNAKSGSADLSALTLLALRLVFVTRFGLSASNGESLQRLAAQNNELDPQVDVLMNFENVLDSESSEWTSNATRRIDIALDHLAGLGMERNRISAEYRQDRFDANFLFRRYSPAATFDGLVGISAIRGIKAVNNRINPCLNDSLVKRPQSCLQDVCK